MKKIVLFLALFLTMLSFGARAQEVTIGTGTSSSASTVFYPYYNDSWWETTYLASEINTSGAITSVAVQQDGGSQLLCLNVDIYMGHRAASTYSSTTDWTPATDLTLVYSGTNVTLGTTSGWEEFNLTTPFVYNGSDNLVVVFAKHSEDWTGSLKYYYESMSDYRSLYRNSDNAPAYAQHPGSSTGSRSYYRPNLKLTMGNVNCMPPAGVQISGLNDMGCTITWAANEDNNAYAYQVKAAADDWDMAPLMTTTDTFVVFNTLSPNTTYNFRIQTSCADTVSNWINKTFTTTAVPAPVPYYTDFNDPTDNGQWVLSASTANHWAFGTGTSYDGDGVDQAMYVSNDSIGTYAADSIASSILVAERIIDFGETPGAFAISFDWKASGNVSTSIYSALTVYVREVDEPTPTAFPSYINEYLQYALNQNDWGHVTVQLDSVSGLKKLQFFTWGYTYPSARVVPAAVDNISVVATDCLTPTMTFTTTENTATLTHNGPEDGTFILIYRVYGSSASTNETVTFSGSTYTLENLQASTNYIAWIGQLCNGDTSAINYGTLFSTTCGTVVVTDQNPWTEDFNSEPTCWELPVNDFESFTWSSSDAYIGHMFGEYEIEAISPTLDITYVSTPYLKFDQLRPDYMGSNIFDNLYVYYRSTEEGTDTTWHLMKSYTTLAADWTFDSLPLPTNMTTIQLKFRVVGGGDNADGCGIDNVSVYNEENAPSCLPPVGLTVLNTTTNSADLAWSTTEEGTLNLYYKAAADTEYTTVYDVMLYDGAYTLDNLSAATTYQWYLGIICSDGTITNSISGTFTTQCGAVSVPHFQGFEGYATYAIPECWNRINQHTAYGGDLYPGVVSSNQYEGSGALEFYNDFTNLTPQYAVMPEFSTPINELQVNFWTRREGASSGTFSVGYLTNPLNDSTFTALWSITSDQIGDNNHHNYTVRFDSVVMEENTPYYIAFKYVCDNNWYWFLDNVNVTVIPACAMPENLTSGNITTTSADLGWTGNTAEYTLYYKAATDTAYTEMTNVTLNEDNVYTLNGLTPGTSYSWYVAAQCDDGTLSTSFTSGNFNTQCLEIASVPVTWDFESDLYGGTTNAPMPTCWSKASTNNYPYVNTGNAHSGDHKLYIYNNYPNSYAVMPAVDTDVLPINTLQISFYARLSSTSYQAPLEFGVMTDPSDASTFTALGSLDLTLDYTLYEFPLNSYTGTGQYIAFHSNASGSAFNYIYMDDVTLEAIPACSRPMMLTATPDTASAILSWSSTATEFTLYYKESSDSVWTSLNNVTLNNNGVYELTGLVSSTAYDWYVETACGSDEELASGIAHFSTTMIPVGLPYSTDFESGSDVAWRLIDNGATNHWRIGAPVDANSVLFLSNVDNAVTYAHAASSAYAQKLFTTGSADSIHISFDVTCGGESSWDHIKVLLIPTSATLTAGTQHTHGSSSDLGCYSSTLYAMDFSAYASQSTGSVNNYNYMYNLTNGTVHIDGMMANPAPNGNVYLVFYWSNDGSGGNGIGATIDNISVSETADTTITVTDPTVATSAATNVAQTTATLNGTITNPDNVTISAKGFQWKTTTGGTYQTVNATGTGLSYNLTGLTAATGYTFRAFITFNGTTVYGNEMTFTTLEQGVEPCAVPTGLTVASVENHAVTVTWDANANVNSWNIRYRKANESNWSSATANTNSYTISDLDGNTDYEIQVQADCGDGNLSDWTASATAHTTNVGISSWMENSVKVFPNPANDFVNVQCTMYNVQLGADLHVFDVYGKLVQTVPMTGETTSVNVSNLADGMYFVRVTTEAGAVTKTFVVKR